MKRYFSNELLSLNGNIVISSFLSAVVPLGLIEPYARSAVEPPLSSALVVSTLVTACVFVLVHSSLHFFTIKLGGHSLSNTMPFWRLYAVSLRKIYATGVYAIGSYLTAFVVIDFVLQTTLYLETVSRVVAWVIAQVTARIVHTRVYQSRR